MRPTGLPGSWSWRGAGRKCAVELTLAHWPPVPRLLLQFSPPPTPPSRKWSRPRAHQRPPLRQTTPPAPPPCSPPPLLVVAPGGIPGGGGFGARSRERRVVPGRGGRGMIAGPRRPAPASQRPCLSLCWCPCPSDFLSPAPRRGCWRRPWRAPSSDGGGNPAQAADPQADPAAAGRGVSRSGEYGCDRAQRGGRH